MTLEQRLQALYDSEINVTITTLWDGGYDLALCSPMEWQGPDRAGKLCPQSGFYAERESVRTAAEIGDKLHEMAMKQCPQSEYALENR